MFATIGLGAALAVASPAQEAPTLQDLDNQFSEIFASCAAVFMVRWYSMGDGDPDAIQTLKNKQRVAEIASAYTVVKHLGPRKALDHAMTRETALIQEWLRAWDGEKFNDEFEGETKMCEELRPLMRELAGKMIQEYPAPE